MDISLGVSRPPLRRSRGIFGVPGVFWGTCIEGFDDLGGAVDVQQQVIEPAVLPQVEKNAEPVPERGLGLLLPLAGLVRVVFGAEPGNWEGKNGKKTKNQR